MEFAVIVDALASVAAIVAIGASLVAWYRSARKPLRVPRVVVHLYEDEATFILLVKNVKPHPVHIKRVECYRQKKHKVQKRRGGSLEYSAVFSSTDMIFRSDTDSEMLPNGYSDVRVKVEEPPQVPSRVLFLLTTSHGFQELSCKNVDSVDIGKVDTYSVEYQYESGSRWRAMTVYLWKWITHR